MFLFLNNFFDVHLQGFKNICFSVLRDNVNILDLQDELLISVSTWLAWKVMQTIIQSIQIFLDIGKNHPTRKTVGKMEEMIRQRKWNRVAKKIRSRLHLKELT